MVVCTASSCSSMLLRTVMKLLLLLIGIAGCVAQPQQIYISDFNAIAEGVGAIGGYALSMSKLYLSDAAFAVATDAAGSPFIAATRFGAGRLLQLGHESALDWGTIPAPGGPKLLRNAVAWLNTSNVVKVGYANAFGQDFVKRLVAQDPAKFKNAGKQNLKNPQLSRAHVLVLNGQEATVGTNAVAIRRYIRKGGGVLIAAQAWYWSYSNDVANHPNNLLTAPMGIFVSGDGVEATDFTFKIGSPPSQLGHADVALKCLADKLLSQAGSQGIDCGPSDAEALARLLKAVSGAAAHLPTSSAFFRKLATYATEFSPDGINTDNPIKTNTPEALGALARTVMYKYLPPQQLPVAPDAKYFPGLAPAGTQPLGATSVKINGTTTAQYWQCLGLYALPGTPVTIELPSSLLGLPGPITLHIGGWTDTLYHKEEWYRLPEIVRFYRVKSASTVIASALGGLIYITLPEGLAKGEVTVTVTGAIRAPIMTECMSKTSWAQVLAASPAPWGEVSTSKLVISTPKSALTTVRDPCAVTSYWNQVMDSHAWLADISPVRDHPMRMQHDMDISFGYMHSGYPIMTFMDVVNTTIDPVDGGNHWGEFHELGHNHQDDRWTWDCVGEVTVNFFSTRAELVVRKNTDPTTFYSWLEGEPEKRLQLREEYFQEGPSYERLCESPELHLDSFLQLIEDGGYGFELLRSTIASYKNLKTEPATDEEKMQTWIIQQSVSAQCNFAPYYKHWGWNVLESTDEALANLKTWPDC